MLNSSVAPVDWPAKITVYLFRMLLIFAVALYAYEALYDLVSEVDDGTGPFGH